MKRLLSTLLIFCLALFNISPALATGNALPTNTKIKLEFMQDFNVNKCAIGDEIMFRLKEDISENGKVTFPIGTRFIAKVTDKDKSKFGYRRAIAHIKFQQVILPNGSAYHIILNPKQDTLKSPESLNLLKASASTAALAGVCMVGATVIAVEALSVAGILFLPYVGIAVGGAIAITGKGLNYKAHAGTPLTITLESPITLEFMDFNDESQEQPASYFNAQ